jgi:hypothetical protein
MTRAIKVKGNAKTKIKIQIKHDKKRSLPICRA